MLADVQTFVAALDTMFGGFRSGPMSPMPCSEDSTAFVVVAAPERDALREAAYFVDRLARGYAARGPVVNRVQRLAAVTLGGGKAIDAAEQLEAVSPEARLTIGMLQLHGNSPRPRNARGSRATFRDRASGTLIREVPAEATDIHDLDGLRAIGAALGG